MKEKEIIILDSDSIYIVQVEGIIVRNDDTQLPIDSSTSATEASTYRCYQGCCELINEEEMKGKKKNII